ncbi:MAG: immunoglobulin domain-containing protein, partial [Phaeodactylibacter sp.]|nr:immunoglobulin domain-containing protein [Phaeodactylibacter sp.]
MLDIYFQPALAWVPAGTQGVALLFIENFTDSPDEEKQDFRELVKSLFRWAWRTADGKTEPVSQSTLEELYALFVENPFSYSTLNSFLGNNFDFRFQECTADMQGAIFPMFPELSLAVGTGPEQVFSVATEQLDQAGMQAIKDYFNALKVQFDPASKASTASADTQTIPEFIFNDYARVLTRNILQRAIDYMEGFPDVISKAAVLKVTETPSITKQPESVRACEGSSASFSITVSGADIQYQWQVNEGNGFQDISDGALYSGTGTDSLTVLNPTLQMSGWVFQCVVTADSENLVSKEAALEVTDTAIITYQPKSITVYKGTSTSFSVIVSGVNILYQWQVDDGSGFQDISDGTEYTGTGTDSLTVLNPTLLMSGWTFQCVIATDSGNLVSDGAALEVTETANILNHPDSITVIEGNNALLSVTVSGVNIQYRWQVDNGNGFQDISDGTEYTGTDTSSLTVLSPTLQMSGRIFRCVATTVLTIEGLLTALDTTNPYPDIAGMVSRFLMHGLHLPELTYAAGGSADAQALYQATHQQFPFTDALVQVPGSPAVPATDSTPAVPAVPAVDEYRMTLKDIGDPSITHFVFPEQDANKKPQITYTIENNEDVNNPKLFFLNLANAMQALDASDPGLFHTPNPKLIPWYRMEALHFALRKQVEWTQSDGSKQYLLQLPGSLITHLKLKNPNPTVSIKVWPNGDPNSKVDPGNDTFAWATRIDLPIQRIPNPETGEYLSQTYAFTGTSEAEKDLLEAVWARDEALYPIHLHLLYAAESGSVASGVAALPVAAADILLIKANLSNDDADSPADLFSADFTEEKNFLQLIWEGSTVISGGYYLYFPGITDEVEQALFNGSATATLQLIIEFTNEADPIHDFNNTAIFTENYSPDTNLILAKSTEKAPILAIPPGFLGFQIDDLSEPAADSAQGEVKNLYQLLGYKIVGHTRFEESNAGLPIGPTAPDPEDSKWLYEKLIPTFSCVSGNTPLPLTDSPPDPYLGVGKDTEAELKIELWWQDLYGNKSQPPHLYNGTFKVRYTDPLIGINQ